jgi:hypothetical protein
VQTKKLNSDPMAADPIAAAKRKSVAARRVGVGNRCTVCGETRHNTLIAGSEPMICHECRRRSEGCSIYDLHHVAGRPNHQLTIPVPVNDHRAILSEEQYDWPKATRENSDGSPLRAIAACIRGLCNTIAYLLNELLLWIAEFVEVLDDFLKSRLGPKWWTSNEFLDFRRGRS